MINRWILIIALVLGAGWLGMANGTITPVLAVDWDADGSFATAGDDISADVISVKWQRGIFSRLEQVARVGTLDVTLKNTSQNYSPEYASGDYYGNLLPGREIRLQFTDGVTTWDMFQGIIVKIDPDAGEYGRRQTQLKCEGTLGRMNRSKDLALPVMIDVTVDDVLGRIGAAVWRTGRATGTITVNSVPANGEVIEIDGILYNMVTSAPTSANEILIGASASATAQNITDAINVAQTTSTTYGSGTEKHPSVSASVSGAVVTLTALARGTWGNSITLSAGSPNALLTSVTLTWGSVGSGAISDTYTQNATYYRLDESASGLVGRMYFTVKGTTPVFNVYGYYSAAAGQSLVLYYVNQVSGSVVYFENDIEHSATPGNYSQALPPSFVSDAGEVEILFINDGAGNPAYKWFLDHVYVQTDYPEAAGSFTVSGATLSGGTAAPIEDYDIGIVTLNIAGDSWSEKTTGYQAIQQTVESEPAALLWSAADGSLVFKNKDWVFKQFQTATSLTLSGEQTEAKGGVDWDEIYNRVYVKFQPRSTSAQGVIAKADAVISVPGRWGADNENRYNPSDDFPASGTGMNTLSFVDPGTGQAAGVASVTLPLVPGTDYDVFDDAEGEGYDYTYDGLITINAAITSQGIQLQITNTAYGILYLHNLQVRGVLYVAYDTQTVMDEDTTSIGNYGVLDKAFELGMPSDDISNMARAYAQWLVGANSSPIYRLNSMAFTGITEVGAVNLYSLDIGDIIDYSEPQTAASNLIELITAVSGSWTKNQQPQIAFATRRLDKQEYWILGDADSALGTNTILGI